MKGSAEPIGAAIALTVIALSALQDKPAPSAPGLSVPDGFAVERVAGPPLVNRPIVADFDEEGRLYVADSSGSNDKVEAQLANRPHRIVRLEDKDGDGRFDASTVFADRMMLPEGTMWFDGSLYVAAPPSIWKLTDTNGDGVADEREEWLQAKTLTGCANDLHGPYLGLDGWIYWTKGAFAEQTWERPGKTPFVTKASHIFRRRPGDLAIEPVMTGGMDNPVDVVFTPTGERVFTATFLEHPQVGKRDALVHAIYGGVYGKQHAVIEGHKRTGDLMPVMAQLGPDVPAGLTRYASRAFGDEYRDNLFAAMFNVRKVTRHVLEPDGATFRSRASDFLVAESRDFHPTDVVEDADGSLLVVDTGPWYKLCCPSSQLAKPEVFGSIYRVRRTGARAVADPRGRKLSWATMPTPEIAALLGDARPAVVNRALQSLGKRGGAAVPSLVNVLTTSRSVDARRGAVWALTRIQTAEARSTVVRALADADESVRHAAIHSAALWRDANAVTALVALLKSNRPALQRAAAEALGRIGDTRAVPDLLAAASTAVDRTLEHSLTYAVIEIGNPTATSAGLQSGSPRSQRAALIALDQMEGGGLGVERIMPLLESPEPILKDTAWWIAGRHPEWGGALAGYFEPRLLAAAPTPAAAEEFQRRLAQFGSDPAIQKLLAATVERSDAPAPRVTALKVMAASRVRELPAVWVGALAQALGDRNDEVARQAVAVARAAPAGNKKETAPPLKEALLGFARDRSRAIDTRLEALAAIQEGLSTVDPELFETLRTGLQASQPPAVRVVASGIVEKSRLNREQLLELADTLESAGPLELARLLPAFDHSTDEKVGLQMLAALERSKGRSGVRPDVLRPRLAKYPDSVRQRGDALLSSLNADTAKQAQRLETMLASLANGDVRRGQDVFNSAKAACFSCHAIGYMGGRIGPDLTRIGQVRGERDLLEAILYPNASFARGYEPVSVTTIAGEEHGGVLRSESRDEVVLGTGAGQEVRIARQNIKAIQPGTVSLMPAGLDDQLTQQELSDLLAFLKATRSGAH